MDNLNRISNIKDRDNETQDFYTENSHTNYGNKKSQRLRPTNLNPLYEIKLHRLTWSLYPKDLLSSIYDLIHVRDTTTLDCSSGSL